MKIEQIEDSIKKLTDIFENKEYPPSNCIDFKYKFEPFGVKFSSGICEYAVDKYERVLKFKDSYVTPYKNAIDDHIDEDSKISEFCSNVLGDVARYMLTTLHRETTIEKIPIAEIKSVEELEKIFIDNAQILRSVNTYYNARIMARKISLL